MKKLQGKPMLAGRVKGKALVTRTPVNFTASFTKPQNLIPGFAAQVQDRHHELYGQKVKGRVLVLPACIGSTYTGMVLLNLMHKKEAPRALIVQAADPLLVSGPVLAEAWYNAGIPVVEYAGDDLYDAIATGDEVEVDGATGEILITSK